LNNLPHKKSHRALTLFNMRFTRSKYPCARTPVAAKGILCAAAMSSLSGSTWAFVTPPPSIPVATSSLAPRPLVVQSSRNNNLVFPQTIARQQHPRLFFSQKDNDNDWETFKKSGGNLLKKGVDKIKSILPFGKSEEEKLAIKRKKEITDGISQTLKDMPLPIRMMGRMVAPLLSQAANEIAEQSKQAQDMLEEARFRLVNDPVVAENLGEPLQVGQPFSQSSSTTVINGKSSARVQVSFQVAGTKQSGIATLESSNGEIRSLIVNINGRKISVGSGGARNASGKTYGKNENIIEAEIIEKK